MHTSDCIFLIRSFDPHLLKTIISDNEPCTYGYAVETKTNYLKQPEKIVPYKSTPNLIKGVGFVHYFLKIQ